MSEEVVLNVDVGPDDGLYRIQRDRKVLYVLLKYLELIPEDSRTLGPRIIRELSKLEQWFDNWDTITIDKDQTGIVVRLNEFQPHSIPERLIQNDYLQVDILDLPILGRLKCRTLYTCLNGSPCYVKFARFDYELAPIAREIEVYHFLKDNHFTMIPKFLGYVYEGPHRVIGFLLEKIPGRHANIKDLEACKKALKELHKFIVHGDLNQYNIIITDNGPKFIDLETSSIKPLNKSIEWDIKTDLEVQSLHAKLSDDSGIGRPFTLQ